MKAVIFDLDNTLFDYRQYFFGAFEDISKYISTKYNISESTTTQNLTNLLKEKTSMYSHLFDDYVRIMNIKEEPQEIVRIFNDHQGKIEPFADVIPTLTKLKKSDYKLGMVTDGNVERQKRKLDTLGIADLFDTVVFTKEFEPKPSSVSYLKALELLKVDPVDAVYIGDNPLRDFQGAKKIGMKCIRISRGEFASIPGNNEIDFTIKELDELQMILEKL